MGNGKEGNGEKRVNTDRRTLQLFIFDGPQVYEMSQLSL